MLKKSSARDGAPHADAEGADDADKGSVEMMRNPAVLALFRLVIGRPLAVLIAWHALLLASIAVASQYNTLKHKPLAWHPFDNSLKHVQEALTVEFGLSHYASSFESIVIWSESPRDLRKMPEFRKALGDVKAELRAVKDSPAADCDHEALKQMSWRSYSPLMVPFLAKHFLSVDGSAALVLVSHTCNLGGIKKRLAGIDRKHAGLRVALGSPNSVVQSSIEEATNEVAKHMYICGPIMWALLWWNTGSMFRAGTAFICLLCSYFGTRAATVIVKWCWPGLNFSGPNEAVLMFVELALCLDYCLFFWTRFLQERSRRTGPRSYEQALMTTLQTSGAVIMVSVCVLVVGNFSMCFYPDQNNLGCLAQNIQMIIGINLLGIHSLVVPASLAAYFPSVFDVGEKPGGEPSCWRRSLEGLDGLALRTSKAYNGGVARLGAFVTAPPWTVLLPVLVSACLCPLVVELGHFRPNFDLFAASSSRGVPEYEAFGVLRGKFNIGQLEPVLVLTEARALGPTPRAAAMHQDAVAMLQVFAEPRCPNCTEAPGGMETASLRKTETAANVAMTAVPFRQMVCRYIENVVRGTRGREYQIRPEDVQSIWWDRTDGNCTEVPQLQELDAKSLVAQSGLKQVLRLFPPVHGTSAGSQAMTRFFWEQVEPQSMGTFDFHGQRYEFKASHLTDMATIMLMQEKFGDRAPWILVVLVVLICVIVGSLFSSLGLGIKMIVTVVLPIIAEFGLIVGIYQRGWMEWAGIPRTDGLVWTHVYTTVGLLLGLAIDYDIFLFARVYERRMEGYDNRSAVRLAVSETASVITVAGTVMCVSFLFVAMSPIFIISQLGVLYFFGVALDTYVIRTILAPSILCLSETMNYWPGYVPPVTKSWDGDAAQKQQP